MLLTGVIYEDDARRTMVFELTMHTDTRSQVVSNSLFHLYICVGSGKYHNGFMARHCLQLIAS